MKKIKFGIRDLLGLFVSAFFLALTFKNFSFDSIPVTFDGKTVLLLLLSCVFITLHTLVNAYRFRLFFKKNPAEYARIATIPSFCIGNFYNGILPGNLGEAVKIYHLEKKYGLPRRQLIAYWVAEKFLGSMVLPFMLILPFLLLGNSIIKTTLGLLILGIVLAALYVWMAKRWRGIKKLPFMLLPLRKVRKYLYSVFVLVFDIICAFTRDRRLYTFFALSLVYYAGLLCYIYCIVCVSGLPVVFGSLESLMLLGTIALVVHFVPSLPSSAGVLHYGIYSSFIILAAYYNIQVDTGLNNRFVVGAAFFHFVLFFTELLLGLPFVWSERKWLFGKTEAGK